jgi:hypothetical protein
MKTPFNIKEEAYEKQNRKMRSEYKSETGKSLGKRLTKGVSKRRVLLETFVKKINLKNKKNEQTIYIKTL